MPTGRFPSWSKTDQEETLILEELCRVIARAGRFQTCIEAWGAIRKTRQIAADIRKEMMEYHGPSEAEAVRQPPEPGRNAR